MKTVKKLVVLYTRIDGVEKLEVAGSFPQITQIGARITQKGAGLEINQEFHEALGLKVGGAR